MFDILHQQSNVSRVINATMRSDTWYNTINSYFMVHFIYRLNLFGDRESRSQARNNQSGNESRFPMPPGERPEMPMRGGFTPPPGGFTPPAGGFGPM